MNKLRIIFTLILLMVRPLDLFSQNKLEGANHSWGLLITRAKISEKWYVTNELHQRNPWFFKEKGQFLLRPSIDYKVADQLEFSLGYSYIRTNPEQPYLLKVLSSEHNVWQQALMKFDIGKLHLINRFRQENRWIDHVEQINGEYTVQGNDYANRFRYRITGTFDLFIFQNKEKALFFNAFDELWFNQDSKLRPTFFSRNWGYLGLGYRMDKQSSFQVGYMNQWDKSKENFIQTDIVQFTVQKNFFY